MSNEKRTIYADGHVYELPPDLESGSSRECPARECRCSRGRRFAKRALMFVVGFFVAQTLLHTMFSVHRYVKHGNGFGHMSMWGSKFGDDVDSHHPHPPHWTHHGYHHGWKHHPHHPHYDYDSDDEVPHHSHRPHRPHHKGGHKHVPHRRPHHNNDHYDSDNEEYDHHSKPSHQRPLRPQRPPHSRIRPKPITSELVKPGSGSMGRFQYLNKDKLNKLIKGELSASLLGNMLSLVNDICIPTIPVADLEKFSFDTAKFGKIVNKVVGGIGSDIHVTTTTDKQASLEVTARVSNNKLAEEVKLTQTTDSDGLITFQLDGPKWLGKDDCAYANIVLKIPKDTTHLVALRNNFIFGNIKIDREIAHAITFGDFEINTAISKVSIPPIHAENVIINAVSGGVHGYFFVSDSIAVHTVRGQIDVGVNVHRASKSSISAESVSGNVLLRVTGGFDGSFAARSIGGKVDVEDISDGSSRLHFDKDLTRVKTGTFSPADSTRVGDSSLNAAAVSGNIEIELE
ncbi:hypothetical protein IWW36_001934 [Coemansia brasiliensis]|uniref:Adhesin domain-containing protein n=1 Tax=Coemansia brasiliensis TaxID=2650707 RepID=A0A9W8IEG8_9FUNG|nr:hypothetical protein IWW36_001934 [Coemansia brasiliensis]